jgi:tRNA (adenine-N(1)-)-methyltransferase non-catalytic subunit
VRFLDVEGMCYLQLKRTITIGKSGSFYANELIYQPYGLTYEIVDKKLEIVPPRTLQEVGRNP